MSIPEREPIWTAEEASEYLRIHPRTITRMARTGEVPGFQIGRHWRVFPSALDEWGRTRGAFVPQLPPVRPDTERRSKLRRARDAIGWLEGKSPAKGPDA